MGDMSLCFVDCVPCMGKCNSCRPLKCEGSCLFTDNYEEEAGRGCESCLVRADCCGYGPMCAGCYGMLGQCPGPRGDYSGCSRRRCEDCDVSRLCPCAGGAPGFSETNPGARSSPQGAAEQNGQQLQLQQLQQQLLQQEEEDGEEDDDDSDGSEGSDDSDGSDGSDDSDDSTGSSSSDDFMALMQRFVDERQAAGLSMPEIEAEWQQMMASGPSAADRIGRDIEENQRRLQAQAPEQSWAEDELWYLTAPFKIPELTVIHHTHSRHDL